MAVTEKNLNTQWAEKAVKWGTLNKDVVQPIMPEIISRYFGVDSLDMIFTHCRKAHPENSKIIREFDVMAAGDGYLFLSYITSNSRIKYFREFVNNHKEVFDYFPEYKGNLLIPILATLYFPPKKLEYLTENGIYALSLTTEPVTLLNYEAIEDKRKVTAECDN